MRYMIATVVEVDDEAGLDQSDIRTRVEAINRGDGIYIHTNPTVMSIRKIPKEDE